MLLNLMHGRLPRKLVPYLLGLFSDMEKQLKRDGSMTFKVNKALYGLAEATPNCSTVEAPHDKGVLYL